MPRDPFDTAALRAAVLSAWTASSTRLAEDAAAEADLARIGYRDRVITELAANAADAASLAGVPGHLGIRLVGGCLHVANTGAPLTADGVRSLLALRVSAKSGVSAGADVDTVGRFGVGFSAVVAVADEVAVRSRDGGVLFSRERTRQALDDAGIAVGDVPPPLLRLAWPDPTPPPDGVDTEVVLTLRGDGDALVATAADQAPTLLLELSALTSITVADTTISRDVVRVSEPDHDVVTIGRDTWVQIAAGGTRWLMPGTADAPRPRDRDRLHAPTVTDVELTLPAMCITDVDLTPDRRTLDPDAEIRSAADGYHRLALPLAASVRLAVVPAPTLPAGPVDADLREAVIADLTSHPWLPSASGDTVAPDRASVLPGAPQALTDLLADIVDGVLDGRLGHPLLGDHAVLSLLLSVGVRELSWDTLCDNLTGIDRAPTWWHDLYEALAPAVVDDRTREGLATIPVPRTDGRMAVGARGLVVIDAPTVAVAEALADCDITWVATVHPDADHPLLDRLGAQRVSVSAVLADPALQAMLVDGDPDPAVTQAVLRLLAADPEADVPAWLGTLPLVDTDGDERSADELLLPDSPLHRVLVDDSPFGVVADDLVDRWGADVLRRAGVGWGLSVVIDEMPVGPDHDLPDEELWWDTRVDEPQRVVAVRDLDLVDPDRWREALGLLAAQDDCRAAVADPDGYTAWWLRSFATLDGTPLGHLRAPDDTTFLGLLDAADHPDAATIAPVFAGAEVTSTDLAAVLLDRLGDEDREVAPGVAAAAHSALVRARRRGDLDLDRLDAPARVRTVSGATSASGVVVDRPSLLPVVGADEAVVATPPFTVDEARALATVLDIPTAAEEFRVSPVDPGDPSTWTASPVALALAVVRGIVPPAGEVRLHDVLRLDVERDGRHRTVEVDWWVDDAGVHHLVRPSGERRS
ncbi:sacsin N-terminal ATP-binding-like domain-containing protein [Williamsia sp. SKLECPSW1]